MALQRIYIAVPLIPKSYPVSVLNTLNQTLTGGPYSPLPSIHALKVGVIDLPIGASAAECLTDDAYFFDVGNLEPTLENVMGVVRNKSLSLDGTMRIAIYAYQSDFAHVRVTYA